MTARKPTARSSSRWRSSIAYATSSDFAVWARQVDAAPVGDLRHRELRDLLQRVLVVQRGREDAPAVAEQTLSQLGLLDRGQVLDEVDREVLRVAVQAPRL